MKKLFFALCLCAFASKTFALRFNAENRDLVGHLQYVSAQNNDTVASVGQRYDVGYNALENANPDTDFHRMLYNGQPVQIPSEFLLPNVRREGIIVNLAEMRLYYFPSHSGTVYTYPVGIGKIGQTIPVIQTKVVRKEKDPIWTPTQNIRNWNLKQGVILPARMEAGPDNPLGPYAIYLQIPSYLIHSTIFPESVGRRASFGCIRMFEWDIEDFFPSVNRGIPVRVVNEPIKVGWSDRHLFLEAHEPLEEHEESANFSNVVSEINSEIGKHTNTLVDWQGVAYLSKEKDGVPHDIGFSLSN